MNRKLRNVILEVHSRHLYFPARRFKICITIIELFRTNIFLETVVCPPGSSTVWMAEQILINSFIYDLLLPIWPSLFPYFLNLFYPNYSTLLSPSKNLDVILIKTPQILIFKQVLQLIYE